MKMKVKIKGEEENRFMRKALRRNIKDMKNIHPLDPEALLDIKALEQVLDFYGG